MFQQLLLEQTIKTSLEAKTFEAAFAELTALLPRQAINSSQKSQILELLLQRELFDSTFDGKGLAVPHCFFGNLRYPVCALGISKKGITYSTAEDSKLAHFVFLTVFPENRESYPEVLHFIRKFFSDSFLCERLKIADSSEEVFEILIRESQYMLSPKQNIFRAAL